MKTFIRLVALLIASQILFSCSQNKAAETSKDDLSFPYQSYLDNMDEDEMFPTIGLDGQGFDPITKNIEYPELPDSLSSSLFADSLLQFYNVVLAYNTMAYDAGTAGRYMDSPEFCMQHAASLDSINLSGIKNPQLKELLSVICHKQARAIRNGDGADEIEIPEVEQFYKAFEEIMDPLHSAHYDNVAFDAAEVMPGYAEIHDKVLSDTTSFRNELLDMVLSETDFQKKCILAREFAYANYNSGANRDDKQVVAVIDKLLRANEYSPLLGELWSMWRCLLQADILGGRSNDSAMYNLFYNQMRNKIALMYIAQLSSNTHDKLAFKEFSDLTTTYNIVRNSEFMFGNNANLDEMSLFYAVFHPAVEETEE